MIVEVDPDVDASPDVQREERVFVWRSEDASEDAKDGRVERRVQRRVIRSDREMSEEEIEEMMEELREGLAEADEALEEMPRTLALAITEAEGEAGRTVVRMECDNSTDEVTSTRENSDGTRVVMVCQTRVMAQALEGLREARKSIATDSEMPDDIRSQVLAEIDQQIERWEDRAR